MALGNTANDYKNALLALAPKGDCWPTEPTSTWAKFNEALAQEPARIDARFVALFDEGFPNTSTELIENWERLVGLPDAFSDPNATLEERRAAVMFKLQARGGQSAQYIEGLVEALGYPALVFGSPFTSDESMSGDYIMDDSWTHYFLVVVRGPVINQDNLEARINSIKPAHSEAIFHYITEPGTLADIEALILSLGFTALVYEAATMTAGISIAGGILFDADWAGWFLVVVENPVADQAAFEAEVLALQPNCVFLYVDDITDF